MRSELVLTEGRRGNRVSRDRKHVERDESSDDDSGSRPVRNYQPLALSCVTFAPIPPESDSEDDHLWPVPKPDEVLDPETGMMINSLNEENIEDNKKDNDQCFLDPQTGLLINPSSNFEAHSKKVRIQNTSNQYIDDENNKALKVLRSTVSYEHISPPEKVKHVDDENIIYQPFPFSGKMNNFCVALVMIQF
jgi:hypothetical protein